MITTAKTVTRQTIGTFALTGEPTHLVVRINGDTLEFREKGTRTWHRLPIEYAARQAVMHSIELPAFSLPPEPVPTPITVDVPELALPESPPLIP